MLNCLEEGAWIGKIGLEEDKIEDNAEGKCLAITEVLDLECLQESLINLVWESSFLVLIACGSKVLDTVFVIA